MLWILFQFPQQNELEFGVGNQDDEIELSDRENNNSGQSDDSSDGGEEESNFSAADHCEEKSEEFRSGDSDSDRNESDVSEHIESQGDNESDVSEHIESQGDNDSDVSEHIESQGDNESDVSEHTQSQADNESDVSDTESEVDNQSNWSESSQLNFSFERNEALQNESNAFNHGSGEDFNSDR